MAVNKGLKEPYIMMRGSEQVERVTLTQYVWRETVGYLLHPKIPPHVASIADVATASGLWLCDLQRAGVDFERLDGFDTSPESFFPARDLPKGVTLRVADATQPPQESARGQYDVVHVRLIAPGIRDGNASPVIEHCMSLLRPGGYLQWEEYDLRAFDPHVESNITSPSNMEQLTRKFVDMGVKPWVEELPQTLESHGMVPIAVQRTRELPWHHQQMTHILARVMNEFAKMEFDVRGPPGSGDQLRAEAKGMIEEAMQGCYPGFLFQVVVAQKPFDN